MLKLYSDKAFLPQNSEHVVMLYPFWGKNPEPSQDPSSGRFDRYTIMGERFIHMTDLAEADFAVLPSDWTNYRDNAGAFKCAEQFVEKANRAGKPTIVFFWSDSDETIPCEHTIIFRTSLHRSFKKVNEFAMPAWSEDFVDKYLGRQLPVRQKQARAKVGFCGYVPSSAVALRSWRRRLKWTLLNVNQWLKNLRHRRADASI